MKFANCANLGVRTVIKLDLEDISINPLAESCSPWVRRNWEGLVSVDLRDFSPTLPKGIKMA